MHRAWGYVTLALSLAASGCGGSSSTDINTNLPGNLVTNGTFTATVNGAAWGALGQVIVRRLTNTSLTIAATSTTYVVNLVALNVTGPTTVTLNGAPTNGSFGSISSTAGGWNSGNTGGTGSIVITTLTSNHVVGTFAFDGPPTAGTGATSTIHVTNGKFDLTF